MRPSARVAAHCERSSLARASEMAPSGVDVGSLICALTFRSLRVSHGGINPKRADMAATWSSLTCAPSAPWTSTSSTSRSGWVQPLWLQTQTLWFIRLRANHGARKRSMRPSARVAVAVAVAVAEKRATQGNLRCKLSHQPLNDPAKGAASLLSLVIAARRAEIIGLFWRQRSAWYFAVQGVLWQAHEHGWQAIA